MGIGVELDAWLDLCGAVKENTRVQKKRHRALPIRKPVGGSIVVPAAFTLPVLLPMEGFPSRGREWNILKIGIFGNDPHTNPAVIPAISQPAVPASGTAVQNTLAQPVTVVLAGFTATQVFVNGILVGAGNGTYTVPAFGSISVTYTVAGTWTWTATQQGTISVDVYSGYLPPPTGQAAGPAFGGFQEVILSAQSVPSVTQFSKEVEWTDSGEQVYALIYGNGVAAGQNYSLVARIADYRQLEVETGDA